MFTNRCEPVLTFSSNFLMLSLICLRIEAHQEVKARFNERFLLSLVSCKQALVMDDELTVLPISQASRNIEALPRRPYAIICPKNGNYIANI